MTYYIIQYQDPFETGLPMGYAIGLIDESNPAPKGAQIAEDEAALNKIVELADKAIAEAIESGPNTGDIDDYDPKAGEPMRSDVLELSKSEFADKYRVIDIRTLAKALGITGYTRLREAELIDAVYKAVESEAKI